MNEPTVNIGIQTEEDINFLLEGEFNLVQLKQKLSGKFKAVLDNNSIELIGEDIKYSFNEELVLEPLDFEDNFFLLKDVTIGIDFHWEQKENQKFLGSLKLVKDGNKLAAINIIPLEEYLTSVISSEMNAASSEELLKAHAIVSRSWLLAQIKKSKEISRSGKDYNPEIKSENEIIKWYDREDHKLFDFCSDDHCQRYQGVKKVYTEVARNAVDKTRGMVLVHNDEICDARYSKSCGGITEAFENVWEEVEHKYLTKVVDYKYNPDDFDLELYNEKSAKKWIKNHPSSFCNTISGEILSQVLLDYDQKTTDFYRWKVEYTQQEISKLIGKKSGMNFGEIIDLIPVQRGHSGRLIKLKIVGTKKTLTIGKELYIRKVLSESHLYSSAFVIEKENIVNDIPQKFVLTGAGWGHGVGLCQIGAAVMSEMGYRFDEILIHYFKGTTIKRIYS